MTDIFFSYKSEDRERVQSVRDAFAAQGFEVFWDQQVPAGVDWDSWIRQHLAQSKCAIVFWSAASVASDNVRHEATVAKQQGKLIQALLEPLKPEQFPIGLYMQQGVNLTNWSGDFAYPEWAKLRRAVEAKLTPLWLSRRLSDAEATGAAVRQQADDERRQRLALEKQIKALLVERGRPQSRLPSSGSTSSPSRRQVGMSEQQDSTLKPLHLMLLILLGAVLLILGVATLPIGIGFLIGPIGMLMMLIGGILYLDP